jgi:transcriptional regulator with XRE-family HTH domain
LLTLRTSIGLTQVGLGEQLGVSRRAVAEWETGESYPKAERLKAFITLCVRTSAFHAGREEEEIRTIWRAAHQKGLLDEAWLHDLLAPSVPIPLFPRAETQAPPADLEPAAFPRVNLVEALDVSHFAGREVEVAELSQWILEERCRLVTLLGMGGIGKSMLASYLGLRLSHEFEAVLWRSVRDTPPCEELVADCITFFSETPPASFPSSLEQRINQLLARLQAHRCLLVLDNLETLLESGDPEGNFLPGYEGYGRLIGRLAESAHQSCVLLTSREKPKETEPFEGLRSPVRSLRIGGMDEQAARELLADKELGGTLLAWHGLVASYAGNPLALKIVAQAISDLFGGDLDRFLREGELIFNGVRPVLRQQVRRLSPREHLLLTWLAVLREWTELDTFAQVLHPRVRRTQLLEALRRRSLLERGQRASFGLQSVVMEYLTDELGELLSDEIVRDVPELLRRVALEQAQAKDYVREIQVRLLVHPLLERLRAELGADGQVEAHLLDLLEQFRAEDTATQGYGPANVLSLLKALRGHLRGLDLSRLSIRGAYLQGVELQDARLSGARLQECVLTEAFDGIWAVAVSRSGQYWAAGSQRGEVRLWREYGQTLHLTWQAHTDIATALAFSPDERLLASEGTDGSVKLWDVESGATLWSAGQANTILCLAFTSDGGLLASGGLDATVRLWDAKLGTLQEALPHPGPVSALAWSPDGTLRLWEVERGQCVRVLQGSVVTLYDLDWSPDGTQLASAGADSVVSLWQVESLGGWAPQGVLREHGWSVYGVAWHPHGGMLASSGWDHTIRLWDPTVGSSLQINGDADSADTVFYGVAWSPDGSRLASCGNDGRIRLWDLESGEHVRTLRRDRPYERLNITGIRGLTQAEITTLRALGAIEDGVL